MVDANGIRLSKDCNTLETDNLLKNAHDIGTTIANNAPNRVISKEIVYILSCNKELIIFANYAYMVTQDIAYKCKVFRYKEESDNESHTELIIEDYEYHGGKLTGTFTYNIDNDLIIAISEYGENLHIPLKVINIDKIVNQTIDESKVSICPEVKIPTINNINYVKGNAYKGWYYFFIRYKIDNTDYTQWYNFGQPIYVDTINNNSIIKYCYPLNILGAGDDYANIISLLDENKGLCSGCSDYISDNSDIANESIKFDIIDNNNDNDNIRYIKYQIGFIVANKTYNKGFISNDINIDDNTFEVNISNCIEVGVTDFIIDLYNYYNVHKVINYNNRLYIGNYEEDNVNNSSLQEKADKIKVELVSEYSPVEGYAHYDTAIINKKNKTGTQYDFFPDNAGLRKLCFTEYFSINEDTSVTLLVKDIDSSGHTMTNVIPTTASKCFITRKNVNTNFPTEIYIEHPGGVGIHKAAETTILINADEYKLENGDYVSIFLHDEDYNGLIMNESKLYNNPSYSFNSRKLSCTLIPNEIYSFYIHFVDKYGHATNGYKLQNNNVYTYKQGDKTNSIIKTDPYIVAPITFTGMDNSTLTYYGVFYIKDKIINFDNIDISDGIYEENEIKYVNILDKDTGNAKIAFDLIKEKYSIFSNKEFNWSQILTSKNIEAEGIGNFDVYVNKNNDRLFKVPAVKNNVWQTLNIYPKFSNIEIPDGYIGYYISYEKFESSRRTTGMLTRYDFRNQNKIGDTDLNNDNSNKSSKMYYYTDDYDIDDSIKLDYNMMIIDGINVWDKLDINITPLCLSPTFYQYVRNLNKANIKEFGGDLTKKYPINKYKIVVAHSSVDNRIGLGTALELEDSYNLFVNNPHDDEYGNSINNTYRCSFYNYSKDIYTKTDKELIRIGDIKYNVEPYTIKTGLNGHYTFAGFLVYNNDTVTFDTATNTIKRIDNGKKYNYASNITSSGINEYYKANIPFAAYVQLLICDTKFHESKHFNNEPKGIVYQVKSATDNDTAKFARGCFVEPMNTIDLFKNRQTSSDEFYPKISTNYKSELANKIHYTKTIRRSNVIQDESKSIAWRRFPIEAYKNISENKGAITNIIGTGTSLLVHTEHSLFLFDVNNLLSTVDNTIQLTQPDSFEVAYKEIFSSILGYGGLKDEDAYIVGEYGYIWFDSNNLFQYDYKSTNRGRTEPALALLDNDIKEYINRNNITNVRFGEDKANNRLLITLKVNNQFKCLSYNCMSKSFISFHTYDDKEYRMYNTKNNIYFAIDRTENVKTFDTTKFGDLNKVNINIIVTDSYNTIKYLNAIKYRFTEETQVVNSNSPVEGISLIPFSGLTIRAFSNETDTNELNVQIPYTPYGTGHNTFMNYTKPYYDRGNWNFNYLFNKKEQSNTRIYGNYLMIDFKLKDRNDTNTNNVMIEDVNFNISAI